VDAYLELAEKVLRTIRRPMTAKAILEAAYRAAIVPHHLHGHTQEKTLQARLSEYILKFKEDGVFFRTEPGHFFLTEFQADPSIPDHYKDHFSARRRTRDLFRAPALAVSRRFIESRKISVFDDWSKLLHAAKDEDAVKYVDASFSANEYVPVWAFSIVRRNRKLLSYRIGRYRDNRESFARRKTIGFPSMISYYDRTFFSRDDVGASECGMKAVLTDLDLSVNALRSANDQALPTISFALFVDYDPSLLLVMDWRCPEWFEPTARRLSLNDLQWIDLFPNDIDDFEPWSITTLGHLQQRMRSSGTLLSCRPE
jgi:hypothetical protein